MSPVEFKGYSISPSIVEAKPYIINAWFAGVGDGPYLCNLESLRRIVASLRMRGFARSLA